MSGGPRYPSLYQVNTRVHLTEIGRRLGRKATLDDVPDDELDRWASLGFDWVWLLSVWRTGEAARRVSRENFVGSLVAKRGPRPVILLDAAHSDYAARLASTGTSFEKIRCGVLAWFGVRPGSLPHSGDDHAPR